MKKPPIGILDMGIDNISILNMLFSEFKSEHFIYINDLECPDYEGLEIEVIHNRVKKNVEILLSNHVKLIVVVSNTIVEYCNDYLNEIYVPVINIVDTIVNYVNEFYEHKNMAFLASDNIIKANIYQKNFRYNHLYNIISDKMDELIVKNKMKTNESFMTTKDLFKQVIRKGLDVVIPTTCNQLLLSTEINEFVKETEIISLPKLFVEKIRAALLTTENFNNKGKGKIHIFINSPNTVLNFTHLLKTKHEIKKIN